MKIKTSEAKDQVLDYLVAQAEGNVRLQYDNREGLIIKNVLGWIHYRPSVAWQQGGPIIEREEIGIKRRVPCMKGEEWEATGSLTAKGAGYRHAMGPTPLVAAMRCYVASKLGAEVEIPEELK